MLAAGQGAAAQTAHRSPAQQNADQRRAQREARRLESPYKESHLQTSYHLRRGEGDQPRPPQGSDPLRFENGKHPRAVKAKSTAARRKRGAAARPQR